jgi:RNA polymerase sigma-70 factor (sigma-E family)
MDVLRSRRTRREFEQFVAVSADELLRTAFVMTGDRGEAEDLVQECFIRLARHWPRVRAMSHVDRYARRVLVNLILDGTPRRSRRGQELEGASEALDSAQADHRSLEDGGDLIDALRSLPPRQRAVLVLRHLEDRSETEAAEILGCSVGTVKSTASRALARLRASLVATGPDVVCSQTGRSSDDDKRTRG